MRDWEPSIKGYAIFTVKDLGMGDIKDLLIPCLEIKEARGISLQALANSPTATDQEYLASLIPTNAKVPNDILNAYLTSKRENSVRKWLRLVRDQKIDPKYYFPVHTQPLLASDIMLDEVRDTIRHTKNHEIVHELSRALAGRNDDESVNLLLQLLSDPNSCLLYTSPSPRDGLLSRMPSSA